MCTFAPDLDSIMVTRLSQYGTMISLSLWIVLLSACSPRALHEAQSVVTQADSMWANGLPYSDSAQLAQAYETLSSFNSPLLSILNARLSTDFAHAGYHYGRLLRNHDDPVAAMQVFLETTHSQTDDYHILGRVYSNMGDICHLAGDYSLSYDMFEKSANLFLQNGDTLPYYFALNDLAFELADMGKKEETLNLLAEIEEQCTNEGVIAITREAKAYLYMQTDQYDSALIYLNLLLSGDYPTISAYSLKARTLWHLGQIDSALYYAKYVLDSPIAIEYDKYNLLYILMNHDSTLSIEEKMKISAMRSDIETDILMPDHNQLAVAIELLEQDLNRKPDLRWLYAIGLTLLVIGIILSVYIGKKRHQGTLLAQQIDALRDINAEAKQQHEQIMQEHTDYTKNLIEKLEGDCAILTQTESFPKNICWNNYEKMCAIIDQNYGMLTTKLHSRYKLSEKEIRLCILTLCDCSYGQMADLLFYAPNGIGKYKDRVAKKMGTSARNLRHILIQIVIGEQ